MSMWINSPGWRRQYRFGGSGGSSFDNRFNPSRFNTDVTVDNGIASFSAMTDPSSAHPHRNEPTTCAPFDRYNQQRRPRQRPSNLPGEHGYTSARAETDKDGHYREDPRVSLRCE
jgi:hypothetical protein